jgi:hypothetical protein
MTYLNAPESIGARLPNGSAAVCILTPAALIREFGQMA